jgi:hypothetical protein
MLLLLFSSSLWLLLPLFELEHQSLQARRVVGPVTTRERDDMVVTEVLSSLSRELLELVSKFSCLVRSRRARSRDDRGGVFSSSPPADIVPDPADPPPPCSNFNVSISSPTRTDSTHPIHKADNRLYTHRGNVCLFSFDSNLPEHDHCTCRHRSALQRLFIPIKNILTRTFGFFSRWKYRSSWKKTKHHLNHSVWNILYC